MFYGVWCFLSDDVLATCRLVIFLLRPLNFPDKPVFGRRSPEVKMSLNEPTRVTRDDEIHIVSFSFHPVRLLTTIGLEHSIRDAMGRSTTLWDRGT